MKQYRTSLFSTARISSVPPATSSRSLTVFVASALSAFLVPTSRKGIPILNKSFLTAVTSLWPSLSVPLLGVSTFSLLSTSRILGARSCMVQPWARHIASLSTLTCFVYVFSTHYRNSAASSPGGFSPFYDRKIVSFYSKLCLWYRVYNFAQLI